MSRAAQFLPRRRTLAAALLAAFASLVPAVHSQTTTPSAAPMSMIGTIRAVDTKTRVIEVMAGVGHAVRILRMQAAEDCRITVPWAAEHLSSFIPGTYARIEYTAAPAEGAGLYGVVVSIEALDIDRPDGAK
jgi:hypothetical protein